MSIDIASVSIPTEINLSGFNSGLAALERTKIKSLEVDVKLNTQSLERDRKQLEATLAKPLTLNLEVDDTALLTLRRRLQKQAPYKVKVTTEVDTRGVINARQQINKSIGNIPEVKICVDDSELYELNKHIELKRTHVKDINKWMAANPITVHADTSRVDAFEKRTIKGKKVRVEVEYDDPGYKSTALATHSVSSTKSTLNFTKPLEAQTKALDSAIDSAADKIADALEKGFKSQKKGLLGEIGSGLLLGATFKGGSALFDKATGKAKQTVTQQKEQRQAFTQLNYKSQVAVTKKQVVVQNKETDKLRQEMLQMNNRDVIQPLAKKAGVKASTKVQAVEGLLSGQSPQQLKTQLPYIDNIRQEAVKTSEQLSKLTAVQLKTQLSDTTKRLSTSLKGIKGTANISALSDLGNQIEKEYQAVIATLSEATEEDAKNILQSAKLQIAKIRKATSTEAQKVSLESIQNQGNQQGQQQFLRRAKQPKFNALQQRRIKEMQYNARIVEERAEQIYQTLPDLPKDTKRIALVSGGFASKHGKSSHSVAERMKPFLGEGTHVQPVENPDTDWGDYDATVEKDPISWAKNAVKVVAKHNLGKGYKEDSIQAAAYAKAYAKKAKEQGLNIPNIEGYGYSAGGFVMQEAAELSRETRTPFKGVGIGTPHYGISNTASQEDYISVLGGQDPLSKLQPVKSPNLRTYAKAGRKHLLEEYTNNPDVQRDIFSHMGREAPFALGQDFEENMMSAMNAAQESLSINPRMRPTLAASGAIDPVLDELTKHRETIADQIDNIPLEILEDVKAADEVLQGLQNQLIKGFGLKGKSVAPLAQAGKKVIKTPAQQIVGNGDKEQQILKNYHAILKEMADVAGVTVNQTQVPKLTVDPAKLKRLDANAYYESGSKNEITIQPRLAELLALPTEELKNYSKELTSLTHELFHSIDLAFGEKTIGGLARGTDQIETPLSPSVTVNGDRMARIAMADTKRSQPRANNDYLKTIGQLEQRAYSFQASTGKILERVSENPQQVDQIRTATERAEQLGKDIGKVIKPPNLQPIINNGLRAYKGLTAKQAKQLEQNYKNFFKEVATLSDFDLGGRNLPGLKVDEKLLEQQSADALYDIANNQIIISKELQQALAETPEGLQQYAEQMAALVHEARHAMQFDLGTLSMEDLQLGLKPGTNLKAFNETSSDAQKAALESVDFAAQQNPAMSDRAKAVLGTVEADASDFEQNTQGILENLAATEVFENAFGDFKQEKAAFRKALDDIEAYLSEGLNHLTKVITDFGKNLAAKAQSIISGFLTGNRTSKESSRAYGGFQYVRRGKGTPTQLSNDIPDPWEQESEAEYRRATPVQGTTPQLPRLDPRGLGQRVRVRIRKPIQQTIKGTQQVTEKAVESFNNRLADYVEGNYKEVLKEVSSLAGASFDENSLPELTVNESALAKAGKEALYDAEKNQIIISRQMREMLKANPRALAQYSKKLKPLIEAARESIEGTTEAEAQEFSKRSGEVLARVSTRAKGKRSNYATPIKGIAENLEASIDALALGAQESEKLKKRARLFLNSLKQAAKTPDNMNPVVPATEKAKPYRLGAGKSMQSMRRAYREIRNPTPFLPEGNTAQRVFTRVVPRPVRKAVQQQAERAKQVSGVDLSNPTSAFQALDKAVQSVNKRFKVPIELYAKLNIKGMADVVQDLQKIVGKELDKLEKKAQTLPYFGDLAGKAVGSLKSFAMAGSGAGIVALRFLSVLGRFTGLATLAAQIQLVAVQFDGLKKSFIQVSNEANRGAETFDRVMQSASELGVDKATAAQGATQIFGNVNPKMGSRMAEQTNRAAQEASLIYSSTPQQSEQIFSAFANLTDESTLSMGSFQQMMKAIPGSLDTAARSMGMTNAEFQNFIQSNSILVDDFLPRFIQQMNVDNQPKIAGAMDTLSTATNRYNNALVDVQLEIGKTITPIEKLRVQSAAWMAENPLKYMAAVFAKWSTSMAVLSLVKFMVASKNVLATVIPIVAKLPLFQAGILALTVAFKAVLPIIAKMSLEFILFQLLIDAVFAAFKAGSNAGGQFNTWAEESVDRVNNLALAFDKAKESAEGMGKSLPTDETELKSQGSRFEDSIIGSIFGKKNMRWAENQMDKGLQKIDPTWKSYAQKEMYDKAEAVQTLSQSGGAISQRVLDMRIGKDNSLKEFTAIEKKLEDIRMQRRALASTDSGDTEGLRKLREQERELLKTRDVTAAPIQQLQSDVAAQIKVYEDALAKIDEEASQDSWTQEEYDRATQTLKMSLSEAEKEQKYLNSQIKDSTTALLALQRQFASLNAQLADNATTLQKQYNETLKGIFANDSLSSAQKGFKQQSAEQDMLAQKLQANKRTALEMRESLAAQGGEDILTNYKVDVSTTDAQGFNLLAQKAEAQGNAKEQEVFTQYARIKELELETSEMEAQAIQRQSEAQQQLKDLNKQVEEYYRGIARQAAESEIQLAKQVSEIQTQQHTNTINAALLGANDNIISQFVGGILDAVTQIASAADGSFDAQSQILQAQNAFEDTFRSGEELRKQLPALELKGSDLPTIPVEIDVNSVGANDDIQKLGDAIGASVDETDDLAAATAGVNAMFAESSGLVTQTSDDVSYLQSGLEGVAGAIDTGAMASDSLNQSVGSTTDSASYLQSQIDINTMAIDGSNAAMQGVGASIDANTQKTGLTAEQSAKWWAELGTVEKITISVQAVFTAIGQGIMGVISNTVDWFKTFANNIPILNTIGQTLSSWGQSIANSGIGQAVGGAVQSAGDAIGHQWDRFTNWAQGGGKVTERYRTGTLAAQEYGASRDGGSRRHAGQDLDVSGNQEAQSFIGGKITKVGYDQGGYGHYVDVYNPTLKVVERIAEVAQVLVKVGQEIKPGQAIGKGETNTGVFHYEIRTDANAQGQGGSGHTGTVDPIKFYEKLGIVERQGQNIVIKKGMQAGQTVTQQEHHLGDGHNHYGEEDARKANQQAAVATSEQLAQAGRNATARRGGANGNAVITNAGDYTKRSKEDNIQTIVNEAIRLGVTDKAQISYIVATALHESGNFKYFEEQGPDSRFAHYGGGARYKGRGMVQLTHKQNYQKQGERLGLDLVNNPELIRDANVAANILVHGMITGGFTGRRLDQYVGNGKNDINNARRTVNGYVQAQVNQVNSKYNSIAPNIDQYIARAGQGGAAPTVSAPQQAAYTPVAKPEVWAPESLSQVGNNRITQTQNSAAQQRDAQQAAAAQQTYARAESETISGLQKSQQTLIQVQKQLRQAGYESRDIGEDITNMNLENLGPLTLPQQREKALADQRRQYRDQGEKVNELIIDRENRKQAAQAILDLPEGIITPAVREKFDKILAMPISEDLKERLRTELTTGSLGEGLKNTLQQSVTQADQELAVLRKAQADLQKGEQESLKAAEEKWAFEIKAREQAAKFEQESLNISTLQARLEQLKGQADREGATSEALKQIPAMEALIALRQQQLDYDKQIQEIEEKVRAKTGINEEEAKAQIASLKERKAIVDQTVKENQAYQELVNTRALDARNREASLEQARQELAVSKQQIEALKALPESDARRNDIPLLEYQVELQELQLKLQEDIAAVNDAVFKGDRTKAEGDKKIADLQKEYELNQANLGVRLKQQSVEQELAQQRAVLGIREQELGFAEQLLEAQSRSIELGRSTGDKLGDRYALQTEQQKLSFEKQILDVKELGLQSNKSAEEIAATEALLRKVNDITLDNITAEMEKAFSDRAFNVNQRIGESNNAVLSAQQSLMSTYGFTQEANRLGKEIAINQQVQDFTNESRSLEEFIKTESVAADKAALLRDSLKSVNEIKFREIEAQFNPLKGLIDSSVGALKGAFKSLIKDGKVDFDSFFDGILDSIAEFLSNMLVEELMGFLTPGGDKKKGGEIFPNATADPNSTDPFNGVADPLGLITGQRDSIFGGSEATSLLGTSAMQPMFVSVTNANQFGFGAGAANNIVPFSSNSVVGSGLGDFGASLFGGKTDLISPLTSSFGDLSSFMTPTFSGITAQNPLAVNVTQAKPDLFSSILGGLGGGAGGIGGAVGGIASALGGGGGFGGIISAILPIFGSLFGFAKGGVIGTGRGEKDDQLILAQRGEGILTHEGMKAIGGAAVLNSLNHAKKYRVPKFAMGGQIGGEYGGRGSADRVSEGREERRNETLKVESEVINNVEYVTFAQAQQMAQKARQMGASDGAKYVSEKMQNSPSYRNRHGIR
jgi:tape measure domain-containing protein